MARLGSLTIDPIQPWSNVLHPSSPLPPAYVASTLDQRVRDTFKRSENHHFQLFLTKALQLSAISDGAFDARVKSMTRIVRYLISHGQAFELLMGGTEKDTRVREWIQKRVATTGHTDACSNRHFRGFQRDGNQWFQRFSPEFTETELEEDSEQLEIYCDKDGEDEIEHLFAVDEDEEIRDLDTEI